MATISLPSWTRPILTLAYAASGYVITEIPVILKFLPATLGGYQTTSLAAGLAFVLSGSYFVHKHLQGYIAPAQQAAPAATQAAATKTAAPAPVPTHTLAVDNASPAIGDTVTFTATNYGASWRLFDQSGTPVSVVVTQPTLTYMIGANTDIGIVLSQDKSDQLYYMDAQGNESNFVTLKLAG